MDLRRRRTDHLPAHHTLPLDPLERARAACEVLATAGFATSLAIHVPDGGGQGIACAAAGRVEHIVDVARGLARQVADEGRALRMIDVASHGRHTGRRHAAIPIGRTERGTIVLVVGDDRFSRREAQAIAVWAAPSIVGGLRVSGGPASDVARRLAREFDADVIATAIFATSGMLFRAHVRTGALLYTSLVPTDTVWGEVARHGAAFTLGDLSMHPGTGLLGALGMQMAGLVGLENGNGISIGALGVASAQDLAVDVAHQLLATAPQLGPDLMQRMSSTAVPVPGDDGSVDLKVLAARVGCRRFAMYRIDGRHLHFVAAHAEDGSRLVAAPDAGEEELVCAAAEQGVGVTNHDAAAVIIGTDTVLYAQDPRRRALERLRLALQDVRRNPFGAQSDDDEDAAGLDIEAA